MAKTGAVMAKVWSNRASMGATAKTVGPAMIARVIAHWGDGLAQDDAAAGCTMLLALAWRPCQSLAHPSLLAAAATGFTTALPAHRIQHGGPVCAAEQRPLAPARDGQLPPEVLGEPEHRGKRQGKVAFPP